MKRLGVVIVTYDSARYLEACLASVFSEREDALVVVVDNASRDGGVDHLDDRVQLIRQERNVGFSRAANVGVRKCLAEGCEEILLLNPDTQIEPGAMAKMSEAIWAEEKRGMVQPLMTLMNDPTKVNTWGNRDRGLGLVMVHGYGRPVEEARSGVIEYASGACLLVKREVFEQVGSLDERFFLYFEDTEFSRRVRQSGWQIWMEAGARVRHDYQLPGVGKRWWWFLVGWLKFIM